MERVIGIGILTIGILLSVIGNHTDSQADVPSSPVSASITKEVSELQAGAPAGAFYVTKIAGASDDDVAIGQELCYRCRYGSRPIVMVFARQTNDGVVKLVQQLDLAIEKNKKEQLRGLVTMLGTDAVKLKDRAEQIATKTGIKHIPIAVAKENVSGPANYKLNQSADVTVVMACDSRVISSKTYTAQKLNVAKIMADVNTMLK